MDVTQQLLTVGAVLAGALLSFIGSGINDRFRFRRDMAAKLIEQRSSRLRGLRSRYQGVLLAVEQNRGR